MQQDPEIAAFKRVISMERLVDSTQGLRTPCMYYEIKYMAINKESDWRPAVSSMTVIGVMDRIKWCEAFLGDLLVLHNHNQLFERRMIINHGVDLETQLGSKEHEDKKLRLLLTEGDDVVASLDMCEDVLLRSARRLQTLVGWAYAVRVVSAPGSYICDIGPTTDTCPITAGMHETAHRTDRQADEGQQRPASCRKACPREPPAGFGTSGRCSAGCESGVRPKDVGAGVARLAGQTSFEDHYLVQTPFFCFSLLLRYCQPFHYWSGAACRIECVERPIVLSYE